MWKVAIIILKWKYIIKYSSHCFIVICIVSISRTRKETVEKHIKLFPKWQRGAIPLTSFLLSFVVLRVLFLYIKSHLSSNICFYGLIITFYAFMRPILLTFGFN